MLQFDVADIITSSITPITDQDLGKAFNFICLNRSFTDVFNVPIVGGNNNTAFQANVNNTIESIKRIVRSYKSKHD